jgi:hypothetical protein
MKILTVSPEPVKNILHPPGVDEPIVDSDLIRRKKFQSDLFLAEDTARRINQLVLGQEFTFQKLARLSGNTVKDCKETIHFLSQFFLVGITGERMQETYFKITIENDVRIKSIQHQIQLAQRQFMAEINYLKELEQELGSREGPKSI